MGNNFRKNTPQPNTTNSTKEALNLFVEWFKQYYDRIVALEKGEKELKDKIAILEKKLAECQGNVTMEKEAPVVIPSSSEKEALTTEEKAADNTQKKEEGVMQKELEDTTPQKEQDNIPQKETEEHSDWIYFSTQEKGVFQLSKQKRSSDNNVCFKINTATLDIEYIHSQYDSRALSYRNEWLLPVCEIINNIANASSIKMEQSGKVIKQGDDFVIDVNNKIKIRLL